MASAEINYSKRQSNASSSNRSLINSMTTNSLG